MTENIKYKPVLIFVIFIISLGIIISFSLPNETEEGSALLVIDGVEVGYISINNIGSDHEVVAHKVMVNGEQITKFIPGALSNNALTIKRKISSDKLLWDWRNEIIQGNNLQKSMKIEYRSKENDLINSWQFENVWISKINQTIENGVPYEIAELAIDSYSMGSLSVSLNMSISNDSIIENSHINTVIGNLATQDGLYNENYTYTLVSGEGDLDNSRFVIIGNQLKNNELFDYESITQCSIRIKTTGDLGNSLEKKFLIKIIDENPTLKVYGNNQLISSNDITPSEDNHTSFGQVNIESETYDRIYTLKADNGENVLLTGTEKIKITGSHAQDYIVVNQPEASLYYATPQAFTIRFNPSSEGLRSATVEIESNDLSQPVYKFAIEGVGESIVIPTYNVIYDGNGNSNGTSPIDINNYVSGASVTVKGDNGILRDSYIFDGWKNTINNELYQTGDAFLMPNQNVTLSAIWHKATEVENDINVLNEDAMNNGSISDSIILNVSYGSIVSEVSKSYILIHNLPNGLDYSVFKIDSQTIKIQFIGEAGQHESINSVSNVKIEILKDMLSYCPNNLIINDIGIIFTNKTESKPVTSSKKKNEPEKAPSVENIMKNAQINEDGTQTGEVTVTQKNSNGEYEQNLPSDFFTSEKKEVIIETPVVKVVVPDNMFNQDEKKDIQLVVKEHDKSKLSEEVKALVGDKPVIDIDLMENGQKVNWSSKSSRVKLQIPYEPTEEELKDKNKIVAVYISDSGEIIPLTLSLYNPETKSVVMETNHFSLYGVSYAEVSFDDLDDANWAEDAIISLAARQVVKGKGSNLFSPNDSITRAEFITMLMRYFGFESETTSVFDDIDEEYYYAEYVNQAKALGIAKGYKNMFRPNDLLSREEMVVMLMRAINIANINIEDKENQIINYIDFEDISDFAKSSMEVALKNGLINGYENQILPSDHTTRAQVAVVLYRILSAIN